MTYFDQIVKSCRRRTTRRHVPRFRIEKDRLGWRVFDGDKALGLCLHYRFDIWSFSPFEPDEIANIEPPDKVVDVHTMHNTSLNLGLSSWPEHWRRQGGARCVRWTWLKRSGRELTARIEAKFDEGESCQWLLRIRYDPAWGRYRYQWRIHARKWEPTPLEAFNLMCAGAWVDRPERRRWTHSIWENPDGQLRRIVHSNALFFCTDYWGGVKIDHNGPWRYRNVPYPRSWVGYAAHQSFNPAILVHRTTVPLMFGTCSAIFDEHLRWGVAGQDNLGEDSYFHFEMDVEFVNMGAKLAASLLKKAKDPVRPRRWHHDAMALPFYVDRVNTFARAVDPWKPTECPIVILRPSSGQGASWDRKVGHGDRFSIRLDGVDDQTRRELPVGGAVCSVTPGRRYRLTGWIKTRNVSRFARLEMSTYEYTPQNATGQAQSSPVRGTRDWTRVSLELDSGQSAYVEPRMILYGPGAAWFDDLRLEEIREA